MNSTSTICDVKMSLHQVLALNDKGGSSDKSQQQKMKANFDKASSSLETALEAMLKEGSADKAKLNQFKDAWASFKKTREAENVPATHTGNQAEPQKSSATMQAGNVKTMNDIISGLGGDQCQAGHKTDGKAGNHADNKADHKADGKSGNHADNKTDHKADGKSGNHADNKTDHKADNKANHSNNQTNHADNKTDHKADGKSGSHADSKTEHKVDNKAHIDNKTDHRQQQANHK